MGKYSRTATTLHLRADGGRWLAGMVLSALATLPVPGQAPAQWVFRAPGGARVFYGVLRDLPVGTSGPFHYYRGGDPSRVPARLRAALAAPPFEVLHFVPLYAPTLDAPALAAVLRDAASTTAATPSRASAFLAATLRATLTSGQRAVLADLATLVEQAAARLPASAPISLDALDARWRAHFAPPLRTFLDRERLTAGTVLISEALGAEGRIFAGLPADPGDNVVALGTWSWSSTPDAPLLAMLRELCFPLVTRTLGPDRVADRRTGGDRSANLAVQCGARLADVVSPASGAAYRAMWSAAAPSPSRAFDDQFAVDAASRRALVAALDLALARTTPP